MNAPSESFDVEDRDRTQRVTIPLAGVNKDDEIAALQLTVGRLKAQRDQLREVLGLEREEIIRQKATNRGLEKKCSIYETMVGELLMQLEGGQS
jgi:hypothetical protein